MNLLGQSSEPVNETSPLKSQESLQKGFDGKKLQHNFYFLIQ